MTDKIIKKLLKDKADSKPDTPTAIACTTAIIKLDATETFMGTVNPLKENTKIPLSRKNKYAPRGALGQLMLGLAEAFAKSHNGALTGAAEMLILLETKGGAKVGKSDKEYVRWTNKVKKEVKIVSKDAFEARLTRIRKHIKEKYPT